MIRKKSKKIKNNIACVNGGAAGFIPSHQTYVSYFSKSKIKEKHSIPNSLKDKENYSVKDFKELFGNIIMSVGTTHYKEDEPYYQNRGIFKNPLSFLEGGLSDISKPLHALTGIVAHQINPELKFLVVFPMEFMGQILREAFNDERLFIGYESANKKLNESGYKKELNLYPNGTEDPYLIDINALKNIVKN